MRNRKNAAERVFSLLRRGPKRGLTVEEIANRTNYGLSTVYAALGKLGPVVEVVGQTRSPIGRPANRYRAVSLTR